NRRRPPRRRPSSRPRRRCRRSGEPVLPSYPRARPPAELALAASWAFAIKEVSAKPARREAAQETDDEGSVQRQTDLRELQAGQAPRAGVRHLHQPPPQTAPGVSTGTFVIRG